MNANPAGNGPLHPVDSEARKQGNREYPFMASWFGLIPSSRRHCGATL